MGGWLITIKADIKNNNLKLLDFVGYRCYDKNQISKKKQIMDNYDTVKERIEKLNQLEQHLEDLVKEYNNTYTEYMRQTLIENYYPVEGDVFPEDPHLMVDKLGLWHLQLTRVQQHPSAKFRKVDGHWSTKSISRYPEDLPYWAAYGLFSLHPDY